MTKEPLDGSCVWGKALKAHQVNHKKKNGQSEAIAKTKTAHASREEEVGKAKAAACGKKVGVRRGDARMRLGLGLRRHRCITRKR